MTFHTQTPFADHGDPFMPFPENTPTPDDLPDLDPKEIAELPVEMLAVLQHEIDARLKRDKAAKARLDGALSLRYATAPPRNDRPRARTPARSGSTMAISPWSPTCPSASIGIRTSWPRWSSASAPPATIPRSMSTAIKVPERKYAAWPDNIRAGFEPARTVRPGTLKVEIVPQEGDQ